MDKLESLEEFIEDQALTRERLLNEFSDPSPYTDLTTINAFFASQQLNPPTEVATILYDDKQFNIVTKIIKAARFPLIQFKDFHTDKNFASSGQAPRSFALAALGISVLVDYVHVDIPDYGLTNALALQHDLEVHERAHFSSRADTLHVTHTAKTIGSVANRFGLSNAEFPVWSFNAEVEALPVWLDEALPVYLSGQYREYTGVTGPGYQDLKGSYYKEHYVIRDPVWPDNPGLIAGASAGQTLENLDERDPGIIQDALNVWRGNNSSTALADRMRLQMTDPELFDAATSPRSYDVWPNIQNMVNKLPS